MKTRNFLPVFAALFFFSFCASGLRAQVPQMINYQGRVAIGATNFEGNGQFKFALVNADATTTYWSNDSTSTAGSQPAAAVTLTVTKGLYSVALGDASITNMTAIPNAVFNNPGVHLRIWFSDGTHGVQLLTPDQRITAVGYAMTAATAASVPDGAITGAKLAPGAAAANLNASGQAGVTSGGLVLSAAENASLTSAGYVRIGTTLVGESWAKRPVTAGVPAPRYLHTAVWTGTEMIIWGGRNATPFADGARYNPITGTWTPVATAGAPAARFDHTAVWTGTEMIIWGGQGAQAFNDGARYNPATNSWTPLATAGAPAGRYWHTAVWTGTEMIVWGGLVAGGANSGGRYNPATNSWAALNQAGMPGPRWQHTAVWSGSEMIVWGGFNGGAFLADGARYNPTANSWSGVQQVPFVGIQRALHSAIWTGTEMIIFGGIGGPTSSASAVSGGLRYNPAADPDHRWAIIPNQGSSVTPSDRINHVAVWKGSFMIVWGGYLLQNNGAHTYVRNGGHYTPADDRWLLLNNIDKPEGREGSTAVWTGNEMITWGGFNGAFLNDTAAYTPSRVMVLYQKP